MTEDEKIYCIVTGKELKRSNSSGLSKERRKDKTLCECLCELSCLSVRLKEKGEVSEEIKQAIKLIEETRKKIKKINEEVNDGEGELSGHHPVKKAIWGPNDLIVPMERSVHARFEKNILRAEGKILGLRMGIYADMLAAFIASKGKDLSERQIDDIIIREELGIRKIPQKTLRYKLLENHSPLFYVEKMINMLRSKGVMIDKNRNKREN